MIWFILILTFFQAFIDEELFSVITDKLGELLKLVGVIPLTTLVDKMDLPSCIRPTDKSAYMGENFQD